MHSEVGPSVKGRIIQCAASVQLSRPFMPQAPTEATLEGDAADWCAQRYQAGFNVLLPSRAPNGVEITDEMIRGAVLWRDVCGVGGVTQMLLPIERIHETEFGTPDHWSWEPELRRLTLDEYKFGHRFVDEFECWQGVDYVTGILDVLGLGSAEDIQIRIRIVQPRFYGAEPVRTWTLTSGQLRAYTNISHAATVESLGPNPRARTGVECLDCPARHVCVTLQRGVSRIVEYVGKAESVAMEPQQIGRELEIIEDAATLLEARATGLRAQAEAVFFAGHRIKGWTMERTEGRLKWKVTPREAAAACDAQQVNIVTSTEPEVCTPTQAKQRGVKQDIIDRLAHRPAKGWKLVRDDGSETRKIFGAKQ